MDDDSDPGIMSRKIGPFPVPLLFVLAGAAALVLFRLKSAKSASSSGGGSKGQGTQFNSSTETTGTDAAGNATTTTYSASGDGFLPGALTYAAGPMPVSEGDIYVNYPAPPTSQAPPPPTPENPYGYEYGQAELDYMKANKGKFGINDANIALVQKSYNDILSRYGQAIANMTHFHLNGATGKIEPILPSNGQPVPPSFAGGSPAW